MKLYYFYNDTFQVFPRYESIYFDSLLFENDGRVSIKMSQIERLSLSSTGVSIRHRLQLSSDLSYRSLYSTTISLTEQKAKEFVSFYHFLDTQVSLAPTHVRKSVCPSVTLSDFRSLVALSEK